MIKEACFYAFIKNCGGKERAGKGIEVLIIIFLELDLNGENRRKMLSLQSKSNQIKY